MEREAVERCSPGHTRSKVRPRHRRSGLLSAGGAVIGQHTVPDVAGRHEGVGEMSFSWGSVGPGVFSLWVRVDAGDTVVEADEENNTAAVRVLVPSTRVFLPLTVRD